MYSGLRAAIFATIALVLSSKVECAEMKNSELGKILHRPIRALSYPSGSSLGLFFAIAIPLVDPEHSVSLSWFFEGNYVLPDNGTYFEPWYDGGYRSSRTRRSIDRTIVYQALENKFQSAGYPGRECLLRSICETSEWPIRHNGILGDVMHVMLTPSSSRNEDLPPEFSDAEQVGRNGSCTKYYPLCPLGLFDLIGVFTGS